MATNADAKITVSADVEDALQGLDQLKQKASEIQSSLLEVHSNFNSGDLRAYNAELKQTLSMMKKIRTAGGKDPFSKAKSSVEDLSKALDKERRAFSSDKTLDKQVSSILKVQNAINDANKSISENLTKIPFDNVIKREKEINALYEQRNSLSKANFDSNERLAKQQASAQPYAYSVVENEKKKHGYYTGKILNSAAYNAGYAIYGTITNGLTTGLSAISDYEQGVVDLRRTLDESEASLRNFGNSAVTMSKDFGISINETQSAMTELARAGVTGDDLEGMAKSVLMGLNTTELGSAEEVTSALVSTIKQMDMNWSDSEKIIDSWNMLSDRYAVQSDDFAHAIERSGSASKMLGMDLYDLNAVVTILGESTQASGEEVGTAFRSLSARLLRQDTIDKLKQYGIEVKKDNDTFLSFEEIMSNINDVVKDLPDDSQELSDIMDTLGGAWRKNWVTALTKDFDRFDDLVKEQAESIGYTAQENEKAMDTIAKKAQTLKNTFLEGFIDLGKAGATDGIKNFLDTTTNLLDGFINSPVVRGLSKLTFSNPTITALLGGGLGAYKKASGNSLTSVLRRNDNKNAQKLYEKVKESNNFSNAEMLAYAQRIDEVYKSNTVQLSKTGQEIDNVKAKLVDSEDYLKHLQKSSTYDSYMSKILDNEQARINAIENAEERASAQAILNKKSADAAENYSRMLSSAERDVSKYKKELTSLNEAQNIAISRTDDYSKANKKLGRALAGAKLVNIAKSIAGIGGQMALLTGATVLIDKAINGSKNLQESVQNATNNYQEKLDANRKSYKNIQEMMNDGFSFKGGLVSNHLDNLGLKPEDYSSVLEQINQLKSISPEVEEAIDRQASKMGNYADAAKVAAAELANLNAAEADRYLRENEKDSKKYIKDQTKDVQKGINDLRAIYGTNDVDSSNYQEYFQRTKENWENVETQLKEAGYTQKQIETIYSDIVTGNENIEHIKETSKDINGAKFLKSLTDDTEEALTQAGIYQEVQDNLGDILGQATNIGESDVLGTFAERLALEKPETIRSFNDFMKNTKLADETANSLNDKLSGFVDTIARQMHLNDDETDVLEDAFFKQFTGMSQDSYNGLINRINKRADDMGIDMKKAFGVKDAKDLNAGQIEKYGQAINDLSYAMDNGSESAKQIVDLLNSGFFADMDISQLNFGKMATMSAEQFSSAMDLYKQTVNQSSDIGETLKQVFDLSPYKDNLAAQMQAIMNLFSTSKESFVNDLSGWFSALNISDVNIKGTIADAVGKAIGLSDEEIYDFKVKLGIIPETDENSTQEAGEKGKEVVEEAKEAAESNSDEAHPKVEVDPDVESNDGEAQQEGAQKGQETVENAKNGAESQSGKANPKISIEPKYEYSGGGLFGDDDFLSLSGAHMEPITVPIEPKVEKSDDSGGILTWLWQHTFGAESAQAAEIEVGVGADTSQADTAISNTQTKAEQPTTPMNVTADTSQADGSIDSTKQNAESSPSPMNVTADASQAEGEIDAAKNEASSGIEIPVKVSGIGERLKEFFGFSSEQTAEVAVHANTDSLSSDISSALESIPAKEIKLTADTSALTDAISGINTEPVNIDVNFNANGANALTASLSLAQSQLALLQAQAAIAASSIAASLSTIPMPSMLLSIPSVNVGNLTAMANAAVNNALSAVTGAEGAATAANNVDASLQSAIGGRAYSVSTTVYVHAHPVVTGLGNVDSLIRGSLGGGSTGASYAHNANGGIVDKPILSWVGEEGYPEAIIPLAPHRRARAMDLLDQISGPLGIDVQKNANGGIIGSFNSRNTSSSSSLMSNLENYTKNSMTEVLSDALSDYKDILTDGLDDLETNFKTISPNGYFTTKFSVPQLTLDEKSQSVLDKFANKEIKFEGWDWKYIDSFIDYTQRGSKRIDNEIEDLEREADLRKSIGEKQGEAQANIQKFRKEQEKVNVLAQQSKELTNEMAYAMEQASQAGYNVTDYLDENGEFTYLYNKKLDEFTDADKDAKETFENLIKANQQLYKQVKENTKDMKDLQAEMQKEYYGYIQDMLNSRIKKVYDGQIEELNREREQVEREKERYQKDIERQQKKLEKERDAFAKQNEADQDAIQAQIDAINDERDAQEDADKLEELKKKIREAQDKLNGIENTYDTKVYQMDENGNWQYSYEANPDELKEAQEDLKDAEKDLADYRKDKEIEALEDQKDALEKEMQLYDDHYNDLQDALEEQQELRLEAYDTEIDNLQEHADALEDIEKELLDNIEVIALTFANQLLASLGNDLSRAYNVSHVYAGEKAQEAYNPLSLLKPNDYVKTLMSQGIDMEQWANQRLAITRNPYGHDPAEVEKAQSDLNKAGVTGAVDLNSYDWGDKFTDYAKSLNMDNNGLINNLVSRIGTVRNSDFGEQAGTVVTAEDVSKFLKSLGVTADPILLSNLKGQYVRNEYDPLTGNVMMSAADRQAFFGSDYKYDPQNQGLLLQKFWDDPTAAILGLQDDMNANIYDLTGTIRGTEDTILSYGENAVRHDLSTENFWNNYSQYTWAQLAGIKSNVEALNAGANKFFATGGEMNNNLAYVMKGSKDVNRFIMDQEARVGTKRANGTTVTREDMDKYYSFLGLSPELVKETVDSMDGIGTSNLTMRDSLDLNGEITGKNTNAITGLGNTLGNTTSDLVNAGVTSNSYLRNNTKSLGNLGYSIDTLTGALSGLGRQQQQQQSAPLMGNISASNIINGRSGALAKYNKAKSEYEKAKASGASRSELDKLQKSMDGWKEQVNNFDKLAGQAGVKIDNLTNTVANSAQAVVQAVTNNKSSRGGGSTITHITKSGNKTTEHFSSGGSFTYSGSSKGYADGGVVDFTGASLLHGAPNSPEVVFNAKDAKKLYDMVRNMDVASMNMPRLSGLDIGSALKDVTKNTDSGIHIDEMHLSFPHVDDPEGVKEAILHLDRDIRLYNKG